MAQGKASSSGPGSQKREPISHAVNVQAVAEIGIHEVRTTSAPLYEGRGIEAPKASATIHHSGSQGKHR